MKEIASGVTATWSVTSLCCATPFAAFQHKLHKTGCMSSSASPPPSPPAHGSWLPCINHVDIRAAALLVLLYTNKTSRLSSSSTEWSCLQQVIQQFIIHCHTLHSSRSKLYILLVCACSCPCCMCTSGTGPITLVPPICGADCHVGRGAGADAAGGSHEGGGTADLQAQREPVQRREGSAEPAPP